MAKLQDRLIASFQKLGAEHVPYPGRDDGFCGVRFRGKEFAHFHDFNELDLKLSKSTITSEGLCHPSNSQVHPKRGAGSHWIELRFNRASELDEIIRLVKLAMKQL